MPPIACGCWWLLGNCLRNLSQELVFGRTTTEFYNCTSEPKLRLALPLCLRSDAVGRVLVITDGVRCLLTYSYVMSCHPSFPSLKINKLFSTGPAPKKLLVLVFRGWDRVSIPFLPGFP